MFRTYIETTETNRTVWKLTETNQKDFQQNNYSYSLGCTLVGRHVQVRHKALVDRHFYVDHKALVDRHARCSTKVLENTNKTRSGAAQALAYRQYRCSTSCCRPYTSWHSIGCCWTNMCIWSTSMQLQATHLRGQYRLLHCRADTQTRPGKAQTAVEETSSRAAQAAIEETHSRGSTCCFKTDASRGSTGCYRDTEKQQRLLRAGTSKSRGSRADTSRDRTRWRRTDSFRDNMLKQKAEFSALFRLVSVNFGLTETPNSLFRYRSETTETNVLFRIVPKLVSVPVSVVSNRN